MKQSDQFQVPPDTNQHPQGTLLLHLNSISFTTKTFPYSISYQVKFWGNSSYQTFIPTGETLRAMYTICSSKETLWKYLYDMPILLVEIVDTRNTKVMGYIPVSIKRFSTLTAYGHIKVEEFKERFDVIDTRRTKVGEATVQLRMDFQSVMKTVPPIQIQGRSPVRFQEIEELGEPLSNRTENHLVRLIENRPSANNYSNVDILAHQPVSNPFIVPAREKKYTQHPLFISAPSISIPDCNVQLELVKLKNDEHLFHTEATLLPMTHNQDPSIEYLIEIKSIRLKSRVPKPLQKLTVTYPQAITSLTHITTLIAPKKTDNSLYQFGQVVVATIHPLEENTHQNMIVEIYFGEGFISIPFSKLILTTQQQTLTLRKKDTTKHSELCLKVTPKARKPEFQLFISLGRYTLLKPQNSLFKLNMKNHPEQQLVKPSSNSRVDFEMSCPLEGNEEMCFIELWSMVDNKQNIQGCIQMAMTRGSLHQKIPLNSIKGEPLGWIEVFWCLDHPSKVQLASSHFQNTTNSHRPNIPEARNPPTAYPKNTLPDIIDQEDGPVAIQMQPFRYLNQQQPSSSELSVGDIYIKLVEHWKGNTNPHYKQISDKLANSQSIDRSTLLKWLYLLIDKGEADKLLSSFQFPFDFNGLISSYYCYCRYLTAYRKHLETLHSLLTHTQIQRILQGLAGAVVYFGFVDTSTISNIFSEAGAKEQLTNHITFFLATTGSDMILQVALMEYLAKTNITSFVFNARIMTHLIAEMNGYEQVSEWDEQVMSHIEYVMLMDNQIPQLAPLPSQNRLESEDAVASDTRYTEIETTYNNPLLSPLPEIKPNKRLIQLRIYSIDSAISDLTDVIINNSIYAGTHQLPRSIKVPEESDINLRVHSKEGLVLEGDAIASRALRSVKLYTKGKEMGEVFFVDTNNEIVVRIDKTKEIPSIPMIQYPPQIAATIQYLEDTPVKIQILDVTPMGKYTIQINSNRINYPQQNFATFFTIPPKTPLQISNSTTQCQSSINICEGIQKYPLCHEDGSIFCIIQLKVSPHFAVELPLLNRRVYIVIKSLFRFLAAESNPIIYLVLEHNSTFKRTGDFKLEEETQIDFWTEVGEQENYQVKVYNRHNKILAEFEFQLRPHLAKAESVMITEGLLASSEYRLSVTVIEVSLPQKIEIRTDKVQNILKIFTPENMKSIVRLLKQGMEFRSILRETYKYTLTEINMIESLIGDKSPRDLFEIDKRTRQLYNTHLTATQAYDEFSVYDIDGKGFISQEKADLVWCLIFPDTHIDLTKFTPNLNRYIVQTSTRHKDQVDYYHLLIHLFPHENLFTKDSQQEDKWFEMIGYAKVDLVRFQDLMVRDRPPNLCIQINRKMITEPILRCSTHHFDPSPSVTVKLPSNFRVYNKEYGGSDLWTYNLIAEPPISHLVELCGGVIEFRIRLLSPAEVEGIEKQTKGVHHPLASRVPRVRQEEKMHIEQETEEVNEVIEMEETKREEKKGDLSKEQIEEARRIKNILDVEVDVSRFRFESSDEES